MMSDDAATFQVNIAESSPPVDVCRIFQRMSRLVVGITLESLDRTIEGGSMLAPVERHALGQQIGDRRHAIIWPAT